MDSYASGEYLVAKSQKFVHNNVDSKSVLRYIQCNPCYNPYSLEHIVCKISYAKYAIKIVDI